MNKTSKRSVEIILNAIGTEPKTRQQIVELTGFTYGTVCRYINQFIDDGLIDSHLIIDNYSKPKNCPIRREKSRQIKQKILEAIQRGNDTCNKLIAETGFSSQTIYRYSKQLIDEGLIPRDAFKKGIVYPKKKEKKQPEPKKIDLDLPKTILSKIREQKTRKQIAKDLHLGYSVICRNIRRLVAEGLIKPEDIIDDNRKKRQFNIAQKQEKEEKKQKIFEAIQEGNDTRVKLVTATGIGYQSVCTYIKELIAEGKIKPEDIKNTYVHDKNKDKALTVKDLKRQKEKAHKNNKRAVLICINRNKLYTYRELMEATGFDYKTLSIYISELIKEGKRSENTIIQEPNWNIEGEDKIPNQEKAYSLIRDFAKRYRANKINLSDVLAISRIMEFYPEAIAPDTVMLVVRAFRKIHRVDLAEKFCGVCLKVINKKENKQLYEQISSINEKLKDARKKAVIEHMIRSELKKGEVDFYKIATYTSTEYTDVLQIYANMTNPRNNNTRKTTHRNNKFAYDNAR